MKIIRIPEQLNAVLTRERARGKTVGFVPTMGALHKGHLSLARASKRANDITVVSIFVNPTQFGPKEDLKKYPKTFANDRRLLGRAKADYLFYPSVRSMYPKGLSDPLHIKGAKWPKLARGFCGKFRPGHFQGVVTVVAKFLNIVGPCRLYLGAKDYQQAMVLTQMVEDMRLPVKVCVKPTVREKDGLAMSSRNRYLSTEERRRAVGLSRVLREIRRDLFLGKGSVAKIRVGYLKKLKRSTDKVQYLEIVDARTLVPLKKRRREMAVLAACFVGKTRLIDNVIIHLQR